MCEPVRGGEAETGADLQTPRRSMYILDAILHVGCVLCSAQAAMFLLVKAWHAIHHTQVICKYFLAEDE